MFVVAKHNLELLDTAGLTTWDSEDIKIIHNPRSHRSLDRVWVNIDHHGDGVIESFSKGEKITAYDPDNEEHVSAVCDIVAYAYKTALSIWGNQNRDLLEI